MSIKAMKQALEALEYTTNLSRFLLNDEANVGPMLKADEAITSLRQAIAEADKQEQGIDWKDMYEKEKRRSAMWSARYERDIGPLERATPQQEQSVSVSNPIGEFPKTILAVIKEVANRNPKNGLDRWTDYETGAYMQDDADAALLWIKNKAKQEQSAEHVGEPVGEMQLSAIYEGMVVPVVPVELPAGTKLYTTPQPSQPKQEQSVSVSTEHVGEPDLDAICQDLQEKTYTQAMRIAELEEALAKQKQGEPVAYIHRNEYNEYRLEPHDNFDIKSIPFNVDVSLFKSPQQRKPLTDEQRMAEHLGTDVETYQKFKEWLANGFKE